jgi:hypothetical protein
MSVYAIHKVAQLVRKDPLFRERLRANPAAALADFRLTASERAALLAGDVGRLAQMGAHGYLLGSLGQQQVLGLTPASYVQRIHQPLACAD